MYKGEVYIEHADFEIPVLFEFDYAPEQLQTSYDEPGYPEYLNITVVNLDADRLNNGEYTHDEKVLAGKLFSKWTKFEELEDQAQTIIDKANEH